MSHPKTERNQEIIERVRAGEPIRQVAADFGIGYFAAWAIQNRAGAVREADQRRRQVKQERDQEIFKMWMAGNPYRVAAERYGLSIPSIFYIVQSQLRRECQG